MLKLPRLVQYDISNLTGTHSMKSPAAQGCREHSRHAPKAMGARASARTAPRHTPASLWHGDGSENSGPRGGRGAPEGQVFLQLPCCQFQALLLTPQRRELARLQWCRGPWHGPDLHEAMVDTLCPCSQSSVPWCPAKGSRLSLSNGDICRRICRRLQGNGDPWGEDHVEREATVHGCMSGVTPDTLTCSSSCLGQGTCAGVVWPCVRPRAPCWGLCHMIKPPRAPAQRGTLLAPRRER